MNCLESWVCYLYATYLYLSCNIFYLGMNNTDKSLHQENENFLGLEDVKPNQGRGARGNRGNRGNDDQQTGRSGRGRNTRRLYQQQQDDWGVEQKVEGQIQQKIKQEAVAKQIVSQENDGECSHDNQKQSFSRGRKQQADVSWEDGNKGVEQASNKQEKEETWQEEEPQQKKEPRGRQNREATKRVDRQEIQKQQNGSEKIENKIDQTQKQEAEDKKSQSDWEVAENQPAKQQKKQQKVPDEAEPKQQQSCWEITEQPKQVVRGGRGRGQQIPKEKQENSNAWGNEQNKDNQNQGRGNQRGRGRGGWQGGRNQQQNRNQGGYQGGYQGRGRNDDGRNDRRNNDGGGFRNDDGRNDRRNNDGGGYNRGNRGNNEGQNNFRTNRQNGGRYQNQHGGNFNGGERRNYGNQNGGYRKFGDGQQGRGPRGQGRPPRGENGRNDQQNRNGRNNNNQNNPTNEPAVGKEKKNLIRPRGQKSWPEMSLYIKQSRLAIVYKQITQNVADVIIFPFANSSFDIYPGNLINKFESVNYRDKVEEKLKKNEIEEGASYAQKCVDIQNFEIITFLRVNDLDCSKNIQFITRTIESSRKFTSTLKKQRISILVPYSRKLGDLKSVVKKIASSLENIDNIKEVIISTNSSEHCLQAVEVYGELISKLVKENKISIEL